MKNRPVYKFLYCSGFSTDRKKYILSTHSDVNNTEIIGHVVFTGKYIIVKLKKSVICKNSGIKIRLNYTVQIN